MDITAKNICKAYGDNTVLNEYSEVFREGEITAIMAPSGRGKTTLLRLILGLEKPDSGSIIGVPEKCAAVFQEDRLCPGRSVLGNIRIAVGRRVPEERIAVMLERLELAESRNIPAEQLSGGMARRTALARALLYEGGLLVLDEPFNGLDEKNRRIAADTIQEYAKGKTVLLVTHREEDANLLGAKRIVSL